MAKRDRLRVKTSDGATLDLVVDVAGGELEFTTPTKSKPMLEARVLSSTGEVRELVAVPEQNLVWFHRDREPLPGK